MNRPSPVLLILLLLFISLTVSAGWETFDHWEQQLLPAQPVAMGRITSAAVYASLALPFPDIIMGPDTLYDGMSYAASLGAAYGTKELVKRISGRTRPDGDANSFPSGHATGSAAALGYMLYMNRTRDYAHPAYLYVSIPLQGIVGSGRVLSKRHYPSDVITGFALGFSLGYAVPMALDAVFGK